ncbi:MAG: FRG domain-containing protein [Phycisphaerales bacterium]|nr:MAG: FRG domain-containing protein [Phycisphaerales bacterium]
MEVVELATFEEFEAKALSLLEDRKKKRSETGMYVSPVLFRGQAQGSWDLRTTLERYSTREYSPEDYYRVMLAARPAVESFTEKLWDLPSEYMRDERIPNAPQGYDFMVYLRHHGFPSPLLDWTRSLYVAAFFAFECPKAEERNVAIYSLIEYYGLSKGGDANEATIVGVGPYVRTDRRHFRQQSEYTFCRKVLNGKHLYCSHEEAFARNDSTQDVLTKFLVPKTERARVLEKLHMMNITAYSLFGSEESLCASLAYNEIERGRL